MLEKEYSRISIRDIRDKANVALGTIYHHFPEGKPAILRNLIIFYANEVLNIEFDLQSGQILNQGFFEKFITNLVENTRRDRIYYLALTQAAISDPEFYKSLTNVTQEYYQKIVENLRENNPSFQTIPEDELLKVFLLISHTCNAYIHRHVFIEPIFDSDEELIRFLTKLINYFISTNFEILN